MVEKNCSKCYSKFECKQGEDTCWCSTITLSVEVLESINKTYEDCLCPQCMTSYSKPTKEKIKHRK